jgi:tryptophanyl-tRNA synthetase
MLTITLKTLDRRRRSSSGVAPTGRVHQGELLSALRARLQRCEKLFCRLAELAAMLLVELIA